MNHKDKIGKTFLIKPNYSFYGINDILNYENYDFHFKMKNSYAVLFLNCYKPKKTMYQDTDYVDLYLIEENIKTIIYLNEFLDTAREL